MTEAAGSLHMDDLGQVVCDEADLRRALARVCSWLYEHGHEISPKKLVLAALAGAAGFRFTFDWQPSVEECADAARREAAKIKLAVEVKTEFRCARRRGSLGYGGCLGTGTRARLHGAAARRDPKRLD